MQIGDVISVEEHRKVRQLRQRNSVTRRNNRRHNRPWVLKELDRRGVAIVRGWDGPKAVYEADVKEAFFSKAELTRLERAIRGDAGDSIQDGDILNISVEARQ